MFNRRKFVKLSLLGSAGLLAGKTAFATEEKENNDTTYPTIKDNPIVLSTWNFGATANMGAWEILKKGGRALDAVEAGVRIPEADPNNHSIGLGGNPDRDGRVTLDACIMDENYRCGSVMAIEHIVHPVSVARAVMEKTPHVVLVGDGALQFALANGFKKENLLTPESEKAWKEWLKKSNYHPEPNSENKDYHNMPGGIHNHDTIGMIAMDSSGNLSGACTTSGLAYKMHGRVGDSPIIGAGLFVDNEVGAATSTGVGEEVIRIVGSHLVVESMRHGFSPADACKIAIERIVKYNFGKMRDIQVAFVALNKKGEYGAYSLRPGFTYAVKSGNDETTYSSKSYF
jgi:N4-(beta-N-acetylglucosaminyl)-L-asparaginase